MPAWASRITGAAAAAAPALATLLPLLAAPGATAQDSVLDRIELRGIIDTELALSFADGFDSGLDQPTLPKAEIVAQPELLVDLGAIGRLNAIAWGRLDPADDLEPGNPDSQEDRRSVLSRRLFAGDFVDLELREFYLDSVLGDTFLRLGKQQIVWGQADGLRVLDVVNPFNFREFILPAFEDYRIPLWAASVEVPVGPVIGQFVWLPDRTYDEIPEADAVFAFSSPRVVPQPPPELVGNGPVILNDPERPDDPFVDDDYGVRLTGFFGGWDLSLNYLYHFRDEAIAFRETLPGGGIAITPRYERTHLLGGTFSNAFGDYTLRGEVGYSTSRFFITNDPSDTDGAFETGEFAYVLGLDYQPNANLFISGQLFQSIIENPPDGATRDRIDTSATLLVEQEFLNDTVTASGLLIQNVNDGDGLLQLDLEYQYRSNIVLTAGADLFYGTEDGLFGQFDTADRITVGIEFGF